MQNENGKKTRGLLMHKQPLVTGPPPLDIMSEQDIESIKNYVEKYHKNGGGPRDDYVGRLMEMARQNGYYPDRVNSNDRLVWGVAVKSELQVLFESSESDHYQKKGDGMRAKIKMWIKAGEQNKIDPRRVEGGE